MEKILEVLVLKRHNFKVWELSVNIAPKTIGLRDLNSWIVKELVELRNKYEDIVRHEKHYVDAHTPTEFGVVDSCTSTRDLLINVIDEHACVDANDVDHIDVGYHVYNGLVAQCFCIGWLHSVVACIVMLCRLELLGVVRSLLVQSCCAESLHSDGVQDGYTVLLQREAKRREGESPRSCIGPVVV
ncbi:hypothetical protein KI387_021485, partial [Taxus chinensis]